MAEVKMDNIEVKPVVKANAVKVEEKTKGKKIFDTYLAADIDSIKTYAVSSFNSGVKKLIFDVIKNTCNTVSETITNAFKMAFYTEEEVRKMERSRSNNNYTGSIFSYNSCYSNDKPVRQASDYSMSWNTLFFQTKEAANDILIGMDELMEQYHLVRVYDMYSLAETSCDFTYKNIGWYDIKSAEVVWINQDPEYPWGIRLPRPVSLR